MRENREPDKRIALGILAAGTALVFLFCLLIRMDKERIVPMDVSDLSEEADVTYIIEDVIPGEYMEIRGYAYIEGESIHTADQRVLLYDREEQKYVEVRTQTEIREELNKTTSYGKNHSAGGFKAKVKASAFEKTYDRYEICIAYRNDGHRVLVHTGRDLNG